MQQSPYIRKETYSVEHVLQMVLEGVPRTVLDGDRVNLHTCRMQNFAFHGISCVSCGLQGRFFAKEISRKNPGASGWHLNLYAVNETGEEVLMTQDHIVPKSKGGSPKALSNLQTMCQPCNFKKGASYDGPVL